MVKHLPAMQESGFNPWVGKIPREGNGNLLLMIMSYKLKKDYMIFCHFQCMIPAAFYSQEHENTAHIYQS